MKTWHVTDKESGMRLAAFIKARLNTLISAKKIKRGIESHLCLVNGKAEHFASYRVKTGDAIVYDAGGLETLAPIVYELEKNRILFEDQAIIVYNKPSGVTSDMTGLAKVFSPYFLVHRLDKETTGVILFAKTKETKETIDSLFRRRKVIKTYLAIVDGVVKHHEGVVQNAIAKLSKGDQPVLWGVVNPKRGKFAKTNWKVVKLGKRATLVQCQPVTGRTHQIRVHMKEIGHPILGDYRYGKNFCCTYHAKRVMLHASQLRFPHPLTDEEIAVEAPLPQDFKEVMQKVLL